MTIKEIIKEIDHTSKPITTVISKSDCSKLIAIGLGKGVLLKKHKAPGQTKLIVIKGQIEYRVEEHVRLFSALDEYQIPLEEVHSVLGIDDCVFLLSINY